MSCKPQATPQESTNSRAEFRRNLNGQKNFRLCGVWYPFITSVRNEIAKLIQKAQNRRKYLPSVPLASFDRAINQEPNQAFLRDEIMEKIGPLGVAVYDCIVSGVSPSLLVGRAEFGSPSSHWVKKAMREVESLIRAN